MGVGDARVGEMTMQQERSNYQTVTDEIGTAMVQWCSACLR